MAYAVTSDGSLEFEQFGVVSKGRGEPVEPTTSFILGSVSKSFTALAIMQLVEREMLELDDPISAHLPAFSGRPAGDVSIRQLLNHTSGFSIKDGNRFHDDFSTDSDALQRRAENVAKIGLARPPGKVWEYSNANYVILGRLIEVKSGTDYGTFVETNILEPAGMEDSFVFRGQNRRSMAVGHRPWFGVAKPLGYNMNGTGSAPQGGVVTSAKDLARYLAIMMNGQNDILSAELKAEMMSPAGSASPNYGYGWFVDQDRGIVYHSGSSPGYEALATMVPDKNVGVAVLVNANSGTGFGDTAPLRFGLTERLADISFSDPLSPAGMKLAFVALVFLPLALLFSMVWSWKKRSPPKARSAFAKATLVVLRLIAGGGLAWALTYLVPSSFGVPLSAIQVFQPDLAILLIVSAAMAVAWAFWKPLISLRSAQ